MALTYAEHLKANGATEEEIKLLDTPVGRRAFDALQSSLAASETARIAKETELSNYDKWYNEQALPAYKEMEKKSVMSASEAARYKAMVEAATDQGLLEVAANARAAAGGNGNGEPPKPGASDFDPNKYFTRDEVVQIAQKEGEAIATAQNIAFEHTRLFPEKPLDFVSLHARAVASRKPVMQLWMEEFGVQAAREAREKSQKEAYEKKLRDEGAAAERERLASQYGNPETRPATVSSSPFTMRPDRGRDKQPWEAGDRSNERVQRVVTKLISNPVN